MKEGYFVGKKLYEFGNRSYEGDISHKGVEGKLYYQGIVKEIKDGWITFSDSVAKVSIERLAHGELFLDLKEIISEENKDG